MEDRLRATFARWDSDRSGFLAEGEFSRAISAGGVPRLTEAEVRRAFALADTNKDGRISTKEFATYIGS